MTMKPLSASRENESFPGEMYWVYQLNWEAAVAIRKLLIGLIIDIPKREYGKKSESKLDKRGRIHTHWGHPGCGRCIERHWQSTDINKKKMRLWNDVMKNINSIHGNNGDVKEVKKKME